jgi:S-adenosylmethionine:tRNA ribosyltransferase-isomerase
MSQSIRAAALRSQNSDPTADPADYLRSSYAFELPEELIAQKPTPKRGASRLLILDRKTGQDELTGFESIADKLPPKSLLVVNNSRVFPARIIGKLGSGGTFEFLLLTPPPLLEAAAMSLDRSVRVDGSDWQSGWKEAEADGLLRPARKIKEGASFSFDSDFGMTILKKQDFGHCHVLLRWQGSLNALIRQHGLLPLPPYIKRPAGVEDARRYQTAYARKDKAGSVAAPTAGLHFTPQIRKTLLQKEHSWVELTLFVGYGTFNPVRVEDIRGHILHPEYAELSAASTAQILQAKKEGRPIIAVGTTSARVLEGIAEQCALRGGLAALLEPFAGWLDCFIYPGKSLRIIEGIITNFHLPESTLLMLVATLAGRKRLLAAYQKAISEKMRFFSYGDAMLIR